MQSGIFATLKPGRFPRISKKNTLFSSAAASLSLFLRIPVKCSAKFSPSSVKKIFPNSDCTFLSEYPTASANIRLFDKQLAYDDVIYITSHRMQAYLGRDCLTERVLAVMRALQSTNRISAVLHFGNPHVMDDVPRCDRFILGYTSERCVEFALSVLAGDSEATGIIPYENVNLKL